MAVKNDPVDIENLKAALELAKQGLKTLEIINGGAIISILTFYGNVLKEGERSLIDGSILHTALCWFAAGLFAAVLATLTGYLSQTIQATAYPDQPKSEADANKHYYRQSQCATYFRYFAVACALVSTVAFVFGTVNAANSLQPSSRAANHQATRDCTSKQPSPVATSASRNITMNTKPPVTAPREH